MSSYLHWYQLLGPIVIFILLSIFILKRRKRMDQHVYLNFREFKGRCIDGSNASESQRGTLACEVMDMLTKVDSHNRIHEESNLDFSGVQDYIENFLCQPSEYLNRPGPVCPFVPRSLKQQTVYFVIPSPNTTKTEAELINTVQICRNDFIHKLEPSIGPREKLVYKCLIIILRSSKLSHESIGRVQTLLKPEFIVENGLMLGEFYDSSNSSSVRNENFYPLRTQVPLLVIRHMVAEDLIFLNQTNKYSTEICRKMVEKYQQLYHAGLLYRSKIDHLNRANEMCEALKFVTE